MKPTEIQLMAKAANPHEHPGEECECEICRNDRPFEIPAEVVDACESGRLVVFVGAGCSTETRSVLQDTFYERIANEIGETNGTKPFPDLMSDYVAQKGRRLLLQRIKERLDYIDAFPELRRTATRFHNELATLFLHSRYRDHQLGSVF